MPVAILCFHFICLFTTVGLAFYGSEGVFGVHRIGWSVWIRIWTSMRR